MPNHAPMDCGQSFGEVFFTCRSQKSLMSFTSAMGSDLHLRDADVHQPLRVRMPAFAVHTWALI
jgi:hypothetical protein